MPELEKKSTASASILIIYAREDEIYLESLQRHLSILVYHDIISACYVREINTETDHINNQLATAPIILVLISPDFLASDYYHSNEMKRLFERHKANEARVLPILLRPVEWKRTPFAMLQAFPDNQKPVTTWRRRDQAFADVTGSIRRVIRQWDGHQFPPLTEALPSFDKATVGVAIHSPEIFCIYTDADEALQHVLSKHLEVLRHQGIISRWYVREINTETDHINNQLATAPIILVLISPDFLASDYYHSNEMKRLFERHKANEARVLPILLRPVEWKRTPFAMLQAFPDNQKPVTTWHDRDKAFSNIVRGVIGVIGQWDGSQFPLLEETLPSFDKAAEEGTVRAPEVCCVYTNADEVLQRELSKHLEVLRLQGIISNCYVREINTEIEHIGSYLTDFSIILVLVSPDFLASDYYHGNEMKWLFERHEANEVRVLPILLRPVEWKGTLFALPQTFLNNEKPITTRHNRDEAFLNVVGGILEVIGQWDGSQFLPLKEAPPFFDKVAEEEAVHTPEVFCVYAGADEALQRGLSKHLEILRNQGIISTYYVRKINTETDSVSSRLATASIILVLISPDFLASDYRHSNEMKRILERRKANEACMIPIILRPVDVRGTPFEYIQFLPRDAKPISTWRRRDEAFRDVAQDISHVIKGLSTLRSSSPAGLQLYHIIGGHHDYINFVAWSPDGQFLASASDDCTTRVWNVANGNRQWIFTEHAGPVNSVAWSPDGQTLASGSDDATIKLWDGANGVLKVTLERHLNAITCISFSHDSYLLASQSTDNTILIWHLDTWKPVLVLHTYSSSRKKSGKCLAFHTNRFALGTPGENNTIRLWNLDLNTILRAAASTIPTHYTNAKVVLVGDSGVGKSGLSLVLTGQPFVATESTHGRRVWTFDSQKSGSQEEEIREIFLWDLAGQPGYRIIHQLHLNEVAVALIVFDTHSETDPFAGVQHWDRAIRLAQRIQGNNAPPLKKFLVAARIDRGGRGVSDSRIEALVHDLQFDGFFGTSAKSRQNIAELAEAIKKAITWDNLPKVSSTSLFEHIKDFLITEKKTGRLLSNIDDLYYTFLRLVSRAA